MTNLTKKKFKILIVDDSEINRDILSDMLSDEYEISEAENGEEAIALLKKPSDEFAVILLDIIMPKKDGFDVLKYMNKAELIEKIPVVIISSETGAETIKLAYSLGATDYINRPFDRDIVKRRVMNTIFLYAKQRKLQELVEEENKKNQRAKNLMISILSQVIEFKNAESGLHINNITTLTNILLKAVNKKTDIYNFTNEEIEEITQASALHDIGKISIPDEIINKPGKLTPEEFEIMKTHSRIGADLIRTLPIYNEEPFLKTVYEICLHHHERYDGKGYPDGLSGDEIPIAAQIVSITDVYDALTSERCYKQAFSHKTAINMICNGECGAFNPLLIECLKENENKIEKTLENIKI